MRIPLQSNEVWWGGCVNEGHLMPYGGRKFFERDLLGNNDNNQSAPFLVSNNGRYLWSDEPFKFTFHGNVLHILGGKPILRTAGTNLREGFLAASKKHFPPSQIHPPSIFFSAAQFNTWIELHYEQEQEAILRYATSILDAGYRPGILMIDDGWQTTYGDWTFHPRLFPAPAKLIQKLQKMGFKVMLWVCPYVTPDTNLFRLLRDKGYLIRTSDGKPAICEWWNGHSAALDLSNDEAASWFKGSLRKLSKEFGVDGFKFDGADFPHYRKEWIYKNARHSNAIAEAYARIGLSFPLNEFRSCWKMGGQPLAQRLCDKPHSWDNSGLARLIPGILAQGLIGHAFSCPDMVGGGEYQNFQANKSNLDQELFVRYAQCSALMPMMQFSAAPWRVLDAKHAALCLEASRLHESYSKMIVGYAKLAAKTGEPIIRSLEYVFPHQGYEKILHQFMMGDHLLVAPVLTKGAKTRKVTLPPGLWQDDTGVSHQGPAVIEVTTPLERLPHFLLQKSRAK